MRKSTMEKKLASFDLGLYENNQVLWSGCEARWIIAYPSNFNKVCECKNLQEVEDYVKYLEEDQRRQKEEWEYLKELGL